MFGDYLFIEVRKRTDGSTISLICRLTNIPRPECLLRYSTTATDEMGHNPKASFPLVTKCQVSGSC